MDNGYIYLSFKNIIIMTKQEEWKAIVEKIEGLAEDLQELADSSLNVDEINDALFGLRVTIDELSEQELD